MDRKYWWYSLFLSHSISYVYKMMQNNMKVVYFRSAKQKSVLHKKGKGHQKVSCPHVPEIICKM
jgi:hypothetical protein